MKTKKTKKRKTKPPVKIARQYMVHAGFNLFRLITVYSDYSIAIGCDQRLSEMDMKELAVKP